MANVHFAVSTSHQPLSGDAESQQIGEKMMQFAMNNLRDYLSENMNAAFRFGRDVPCPKCGLVAKLLIDNGLKHYWCASCFLSQKEYEDKFCSLDRMIRTSIQISCNAIKVKEGAGGE